MSTELIYKTISTSSDDTKSLGEILAGQIKPPFLIELRADLGGGKTTLVKGIARGLKSVDQVNSPTFTLNNVYKCPGEVEIHHFDFYRLEEPGVLREQLAESISDNRVITIVEWSDIVSDVLPTNKLIIELTPTADNPDERQITIIYPEQLTDVVRGLKEQQGSAKP